MARLISDILKVPEPTFSHELERLESIAGQPKIDVQLVSELIQEWQNLAAKLDLDSRDTSGAELYFALRKKVIEQNDRLAEELKIKPSDKPEKVAGKCINYAQQTIKKRPVWSIKNSVLRSQLKKNQPKKALKVLKLRSIDSAIKREPITLLTVLAKNVETKTWLENYALQASKLKNSDFDRKNIEINLVDQKRIEKITAADYSLGQFVYRDEEAAGIIVVPPKKRFVCDVLFLVDAIFREANEIRRWSSFARYLSVKPNFGSWIGVMRSEGLERAATRHFAFGWSPVHQLLHSNAVSGADAIFEPHINHDDVELDSFNLEPVLKYSFLLKNQEGTIVSCNVSDLIINTANDADIDKSISIHGRKELYAELFARYLRHQQVLEDFLG